MAGISISAKLAEANEKIARIEAENKKLSSEAWWIPHLRTENAKIKNELEQAHAFLDAVGAPSKKPEGSSEESYSAVTRIAAWIATRK